MADALIAFRDGDKGDMGHAGAMILAESLGHLRLCADFAKGYAAALSKRGKK
jgi:hypothetical protein